MYCIHCGKKLPEDARFCSGCGAPVVGAPKPSAPTSETPVTSAPAPEVKIPEVHMSEEQAPEGTAHETQIPVEDTVPVSELFADAPAEEAQADGAEHDALFGKAPADTVYTPVAQDIAARAVPPKKKKRKTGLILGITIPAVFLVTLFVTVVVLILSAAPERAPVATTAYVSAGGTAYVCYEDGKFLEVGKEISNATLSPDRQHLVVQDRKGKFYLTDIELSEKTELIRFDPKKETLMYVCSNVGVFFSVMNSESGEVGYYSYYFDLEGEEVIEIVSGKRSEFDDVTVGFDPYGDSYAMAYAQEGDIFLFDAYSDRATKVSSYRENETINLIGVSSDASLLAWTQTDITGTAKLHLREYGEVSILSTMAERKECALITSPMNAGLWVLTCGETVYYRHWEGDVETMTFPSQVVAEIYTTNGLLLAMDEESYSATGFYVRAEDDLYLVEIETAERAKLTDGVDVCYINGDMLYYLDEEQTLFCAPIDVNGAKLGDKEQIDTQVYNLKFAAGENDYVYYLKNPKEQDVPLANLHMYDVQGKETKRIRSGVSEFYYVSTDGRAVYYLDDLRESSTDSEPVSVSVVHGTLTCYQPATEQTEKIEDQVIVWSLTSHLLTGEIDPEDMWFCSYQMLKNSSYQYNIHHYNGKESKVKIKGMMA